MIWASTIISCWNFVCLPVLNNTDNAENKNSSFHRIYSDCGSDVSDESDTESELNTSQQSNRSIRSARSGRHSLRHNNSTLNTSFLSQAPSMFSTSTYTVKKPQRASMHNLLQANRFDSESIRSFDRGSHIDLTRDLYDGNQSVYSTAVGSAFNHFDSRPQSPASLTGSVSQLYARDAANFVSRCSSRLSMNDIPDEFESGITQLSISGAAKNRENYRNLSGNQANESIAPFAFRQRKTLLLPARLSYHETNQHDASIAANQSSWLAGGYWNNTTSPQKRQQYKQTK